MKRLVVLAMLAASLAPLTGCIIAPYHGDHHWQGGYRADGAYHPGYWH